MPAVLCVARSTGRAREWYRRVTSEAATYPKWKSGRTSAPRLPHAEHTNRDPRHGWGAKQRLQRKTAIFQLMPSIKFESNGGSSYDNECSYRDAAMVRRSFNDVRLHELAPSHLNYRTSAKYYIDRDQLAVGRNSQCGVKLLRSTGSVYFRKLGRRCELVGERAPQRLPAIREILINVIHRHAPASTKLCFNTNPTDTADAVLRWV
jgi:hypothetical protein